MTGHQILVVEDDTAIARVISLMLRSEGFEVSLAADGRAGLEELKENDYELVLLDLSLPVMDGPTMFREARRSGINTPVLIVSAHRAKDACRELGADGAIEKPFNPDELTSKVKELIGATEA